jgi:Fic family protein
MVYHEIRIVNGKKKNYLVYNRRKNGKWVKKSRLIGIGGIAKGKINELKEEFEIELINSKKYPYLKKEQIIRIEKLKRDYLKKIGSLSKEEFERFENSFFTELTYNSNAIEGSSLSLEETSLVVNENLAPKGKTTREIYEAKNHIKTLNFINSYKGELDERFILKLHSLILENISERFAGKYRESNVKIFGSDAKFPDSDRVPQLVKNLIYWYNNNKNKCHQFELAIIFSMKFVSIHPFVDGNGRVSRLVMNFILKKKGYPWINVYNKLRAEYLSVVRKANDEEYLPVLEFMIKSLEENLRDFKIV